MVAGQCSASMIKKVQCKERKQRERYEMSEYLGFKPTTRPNYFFVSYNSEDCVRVGKVASQLFHADVPLWYDYGLEYGEKWETQISGKIKDTQAMLLFLQKVFWKRKIHMCGKNMKWPQNILAEKCML